MKSKNHETSFDWSEVKFCPRMKLGQDVLSIDTIVNKTIRTLFPECMRDILLKRYERMSANCTKTLTNVSDWSQNNDACSIANANKYKDMLLEVKQRLFEQYPNDELAKRWNDILDYPCVGHDLPVWLVRKGQENPPRVMILSQDPLRKGLGRGKLTISSPWALHSPEYRQKISHDLVFKVFEALLADGVEIYLTDYKKIFLPRPSHTQCCKACIGKLSANVPTPRRVSSGFDEVYQKLVKEECSLFQPELIVAFGSQAQTLFRKMENLSESQSVQHLERIHPGRWRFLSRERSDAYLRNDNVQTKLDYYVKIIKSELDKVRLHNASR